MDNNAIADIIEQSINKMYANITDVELRIKEYTILYNPNKSDNWIIIFFFSDNACLKNSLNDGFCYSADQFMRNELTSIDQPIVIQFDLGKRPLNKTEIEQLYEKHIKTYDKLENENGKIELCPTCGHSWDKHKLLGSFKKPELFPTEGWMICPNEDCYCFRTWGIKHTKNTQEGEI